MKRTQIPTQPLALFATAGLTLFSFHANPAQFEDVTVKAGVTNAPGYSLSAAWGDYNNDNSIDLYMAIGAKTASVNALYRNNGNGTFTRIGSEAGPIATDSRDSMGCAWVDFNNDGYRDMLVVNGGWTASRNDLYWNNGDGTFRSGNAGNLTLLSEVRSWPAFADYDGDGWVDLYVAEGTSGSGPFTPRLYRATTYGTFIGTNLCPALQYANDAVWGDYDNDGDPDLYACNGTSPSTFWRNDGKGQFTAVDCGLPSSSVITHAAWADYDRDGDLDIALCTWTQENVTKLYRNDGANGFVLVTSLPEAISGPAWADYDNDGYFDLLVTGGQNTPRKPALYHNNGDSTFTRAADVFTEAADNSLACPWGDFDNDGFMDVILTHQYGQHRLYHNLGNTNHWIKFKLIGTASNRDAIGAKVRVQATIGGQSVWQMQEVNGGYQFQSDTRLNFGLGDATIVDKVRIEWPSGNVQEYTSVSVDQIVAYAEVVYITPVRPAAATGSSVTLTAQGSGTRQWYHEGELLQGQTNTILGLTNIQFADAGRYWVVTSLAGTFYTNLVYLRVSAAQFEDVTVRAGVTNAPGYCIAAGWGDYDNDQDIDLYLAIGFGTPATNAFFRNNGNGTFTRVGSAAGPIATDFHPSAGCAWVDFNNDGYRDLLVLNLSTTGTRNDLYWNNGDGTFRSGNAGNLTQRFQFRSWSAAADYDGDGWVDIYVTEADSYPYAPCSRRLYHASPDGTFTSTNLGPTVAYANDAVWGDYDNDGDPDLFICGTSGSALWRNDGHGNFTPLANGLPSSGQTVHAAWADYDRDGDLDIALSSLSDTRLYRNDGTNGFTLQTILNAYAGGTWADYDNDGFLDLLVVGGQNSAVKPGLFHNNGDGSFSRMVDVFTEVGDNSLACPWGDFDNDGFMDVVLTHQYGRHKLYRNLTNSNHWIKFKLIGTASNRDAIGAKVRIQATIAGQAVWQMQEVNGGYAMQNDTGLNFGLGDATIVDKVRIEWPSGNVQEYSSVSVNRIGTITEQVLITPVRPTASIGGSVTLTSQRIGLWQWYHDGVLLQGQTNRTLNLSAIQVTDGGRYSVVTTSGTAIYTSFVYLFVDTQFTKITAAPMCTDRGYMFGCAWGDYDNDGYSDLFVADGSWFATTTNHLYHNNGDGTFARMTTNDVGSVVGDRGGWRGCAWGDYDNDGFLDLYVTQDNGLRYLYHNNTDGRFTRVTTNGPLVTEAGYGQGVSWGDYDRDGFLDLFVATAAAGYHGFTGGNSLYHNTGNGTFTKVTTGPIPADQPAGGAATFCGAWADFDNDGDLDLVAGGGTGPKFVYQNGGGGQFFKIISGALPQDYAYPLFFSWGDYDNDGLLDLFSGEWNQQCRLFHNKGGGQFTKTLFPPGSYETRGGVWGDYDNDGYLDLFIPIGGFNPGNSLLYHNNGDGTFTQITTSSLYADYGHTVCAAWCDYDNDGFLDLFVDYGFGEPNSLFHNNGNNNSWLLFKLIGTRSNRAGIGAKVRVKATIGGKTFWQMREISGGDGVQNDLRPHFGLGDAGRAAVVRIEWPSGIVEEFANVSARQILTIVEPSLKGALAQDGKFHVAMTMSTNRVYQLQASTDLLNWTTLTNCTGSGSCTPVEYVDPEAPTVGSARFFRMK